MGNAHEHRASHTFVLFWSYNPTPTIANRIHPSAAQVSRARKKRNYGGQRMRTVLNGLPFVVILWLQNNAIILSQSHCPISRISVARASNYGGRETSSFAGNLHYCWPSLVIHIHTVYIIFHTKCRLSISIVCVPHICYSGNSSS